MRKLTIATFFSLELLLATGAVDTPVSSIDLSKYTYEVNGDILRRQKNKILENCSDPYGGFKYLKEGEFVIPYEILQAMRAARIPSSNKEIIGRYQHDSLELQMIDRFADYLKSSDLEEEEKEGYLEIFKRPRTILYNSNIFEDIDFNGTFLHERFHKRKRKMSKRERRLLETAHKDMLISLGKPAGIDDSHLSENEFFSYMVEGDFPYNYEIYMKDRHPEAYKIFERVKNEERIGF